MDSENEYSIAKGDIIKVIGADTGDLLATIVVVDDSPISREIRFMCKETEEANIISFICPKGGGDVKLRWTPIDETFRPKWHGGGDR